MKNTTISIMPLILPSSSQGSFPQPTSITNNQNNNRVTQITLSTQFNNELEGLRFSCKLIEFIESYSSPNTN